jgi:hypothetical protein
MYERLERKARREDAGDGGAALAFMLRTAELKATA